MKTLPKTWGIASVPKAEREAARALGQNPKWLPWVEAYTNREQAKTYIEHLAMSVAKWHPEYGAWRGWGVCYICRWQENALDDEVKEAPCRTCPLAELVGVCSRLTPQSAFVLFLQAEHRSAAEQKPYADLIFEALLILYQREWFRVHGMDVLGKHPEEYLDKKKAKP